MTGKPSQRALALDLGDARIGVAVGEHGLATPHSTLPAMGRDKLVRAVGELVARERIEVIVLGLPVAHAGEEGPRAQAVRRLATRLERALDISVALVDEFETTVEAMELMEAAGVSRAKRREKVDQVAAAIILQRYFEGRGEQ